MVAGSTGGRLRKRAADCTLEDSTSKKYAAIYLHDEGSREGSSTRYQSARGHLAVVLLRRQDRCARVERRRQELAAEDHVRRGPELHRRGILRRRDFDRLSQAGAAARSRQDRARQRRGG